SSMMKRTLFPMLLVLMLGLPLISAAARPQETPPSAPVPAQQPPEPPAPAATPAVRRLLEESERLADEAKFGEALAAADRALQVARETCDAAGEAMAQWERALWLHELDRDREAIVAWEAAATAWERVGDVPGQVRALCEEALLRIIAEPGNAEALLQRAIFLA